MIKYMKIMSSLEIRNYLNEMKHKLAENFTLIVI